MAKTTTTEPVEFTICENVKRRRRLMCVHPDEQMILLSGPVFTHATAEDIASALRANRKVRRRVLELLEVE